MDKKSRNFLAINPFEKKILKIVLLSAVIPIFIVMGFFYCLFSDLVYSYLKSNMGDQFLRQFFTLTVVMLVYYFIFLGIVAYYFVHKIAGPLPRIFRELDRVIAGNSRSHISLRRGDSLKELVSRINILIDKLAK